MVGDAEATRRRLIDAAVVEFSRYGIAGARVDRIAAAARSNKAQIYHYFGSKEALFEAVLNSFVEQTLRTAPIDPLDLPEYAGRLFDGYENHPEMARLAAWYSLERHDTDRPLAAIVTANRAKIAAIEKAQRAGKVPATFEAADLLALVVTISAMWAVAMPEFGASSRRRGVAHRRAVVTGAVAALLG